MPEQASLDPLAKTSGRFCRCLMFSFLGLRSPRQLVLSLCSTMFCLGILGTIARFSRRPWRCDPEPGPFNRPDAIRSDVQARDVELSGIVIMKASLFSRHLRFRSSSPVFPDALNPRPFVPKSYHLLFSSALVVSLSFIRSFETKLTLL
ncbi:Peroxiredoxin-1 [Fusarium oxysporum f. sp. albedinis]|nr:Peroxiredoxin-1 [Fusarium oxysporum f. sp. albedinis]